MSLLARTALGVLLVAPGCESARYMAQAQAAERRGDVDGAIRAYEQALQKYSLNYRAAYRIAALECHARQDAVRCRRWSDRLAALQPHDPRPPRLQAQAHALAARHARQRHDAVAARAEVAAARRRDAGNLLAALVAGDVALDEGRLEEALHLYQQVVRRWPRSPAGHRRIEALFRTLHREAEADAAAARARDLEPHQPPAPRAVPGP